MSIRHIVESDTRKYTVRTNFIQTDLAMCDSSVGTGAAWIERGTEINPASGTFFCENLVINHFFYSAD